MPNKPNNTEQPDDHAEASKVHKSLRFPANDETMDCPNCKGRSCAFSYPRDYHTYWTHNKPSRGGAVEAGFHVAVAYCRSCGEPVIEYGQRPRGVRPDPSTEDRIVFPLATVREPTPPEVRDEHSELATDYDEALACEPHSLQAAALLLGRCASIVLIEKCSADKAGTLGAQYNQAKAADKLPAHVVEQFDGLLAHRNRSAHPWFAPTGEHLKVAQDDVDWCFEVVGLLFEHFYVGPARVAERKARLVDIQSRKT